MMFNEETNFRDIILAVVGSVALYLIVPDIGLTRPEQIVFLVQIWMALYAGLQDISLKMKNLREARERIRISRLRIEQARRCRKVIDFPARKKSLWFIQVDENGTEKLEWL